jgi:hypothetical protein
LNFRIEESLLLTRKAPYNKHSYQKNVCSIVDILTIVLTGSLLLKSIVSVNRVTHWKKKLLNILINITDLSTKLTEVKTIIYNWSISLKLNHA